MPLYPLLPSFSAGEVAPALWARTDLEKYHLSLKSCRDCLVMPHGGLKNRPGTFYRGASYSSSKKSRLIPFGAGSDGNYVLEFSGYKIRFWYDGGLVLDGATPLTVATPYSASKIFDLSYVQSADVLYLAHPDYPTRQLSRVSATSWTLEEFDFNPSPVLDLYDDDVTLTMSPVYSSTGKEGEDVYLASDVDFFASDWLNRWIRIDWTKNEEWLVDGATYISAGAFSDDPGAWEVDGEWEFRYRYHSAAVGSEGDIINLEYSIDGGATWSLWQGLQKTTAQTVVSGELLKSGDGTVPKMRLAVPSGVTSTVSLFFTGKSLQEERHGYLKITSYLNAQSVACRVMEDCLCTDGRALKTFYLGAFCQDQGYPTSVGFFEDRFVVASTPAQPEKVWLSKSSSYGDFGTSVPLEDADSISLIAATRRINTVRHVVGLSDMILFCSEGEFKVDAADSAALTPSSKRCRQQGYRGSSELIPLPIGEVVLFVQSMGSRVRSLGYSFETDGYVGSDLSILAQHLFSGHTLVDWCYQQEPWSMVWAVRDDGKVLSLTYLKEHEVFAWALQDFGGTVESICSIPGTDQDEVYMVASRTIDGSTVRYVEQLAHRFEPTHDEGNIEEAYFVDCGLTYSGSAADVISGLDHLEGEEVVALADGVVISGLTVTSGSVTLPDAAELVHVGLPFTPYVQTLEVDFQTKQGTSMGRKKRVARATLRVADTLGLKVGPASDKLTDIRKLIPGDDGTDELFTGDIDHALTGGYSEGGTVCLSQPYPLPFELLAIVPHIDS